MGHVLCDRQMLHLEGVNSNNTDCTLKKQGNSTQFHMLISVAGLNGIRTEKGKVFIILSIVNSILATCLKSPSLHIAKTISYSYLYAQLYIAVCQYIHVQ